MPPKAPDASNDGDADLRRNAGSPRRIQELQENQRLQLEEAITDAMLAACGEMGFRRVTVDEVVERYGGYRAQFYRRFANLGECYLAAYEVKTDALCTEILQAAAAAAGWREGLEAALNRLAAFVSERPEIARALLIDVHVAGGPVLAKRREIFERLSRALDGARRETKSRHSPPPLTAPFMVSAVEASVVSVLISGEPRRFEESLPELTQMIVTAYFGDETAE